MEFQIKADVGQVNINPVIFPLVQSEKGLYQKGKNCNISAKSLSCHRTDYKWEVLKINKEKLLNHFTKPNKSRPKTWKQ